MPEYRQANEVERPVENRRATSILTSHGNYPQNDGPTVVHCEKNK